MSPAILPTRAYVAIALACGVLAVAVRTPVLLRADVGFDSDNALGPLMSLAILGGDYWPLMVDGQDYLGALDAWLIAPLARACGPGPLFWAVGQTVVLALAVVPLCCALGARVGGAWGAIAAGLVAASGPSAVLVLTACAPLGYLTNVAFGALALLLATTPAPLTPRRLVALGFVAGAGWWNSPQLAVFALPAAFAVWTRSALARARGLPGPPSAVRAAWAVVPWLVLAVAVGVIALPFVTSVQVTVGPLSATPGRVNRYLEGLARLLVAWAVVGELVFARDRVRLVRGAVAFALGALVGAAPLVVYRLAYVPTGIVPIVRLYPADALNHAAAVGEGVAAALTGSDACGLASAAILAALGIVLLARHAGALCDLATLRVREGPSRLVAIVVVAPALVLLGTMLLRGPFLSGPRHYLALLVPAGGLVAWAAGACALRSRVLGAAVLGLLVARGVLGAWSLPSHLDSLARPDRDRLLGWLEARGIRHGYGQYWVAFELTFLSRARVLLACDYDPIRNLNRFRAWPAIVRRSPGDQAVVLDLDWPANDLVRVDNVHDALPGRLVERRRFGPRYVVLVYRRTP